MAAEPSSHSNRQLPRGADRLAAAMTRAGVDTVFSLSGNQIMPLYDAFIDTATRVVHTRHEAAAVFMAEAYSQLSGRLGVALVTAAPGFGNALGALYTAAMSEVPVVLLSGDSPLARDGQGAFQEFDQTAAAAPFVKASRRLGRDDDPARAFAEAARLAHSGTPGPVHLALPVDLLNGPYSVSAPLPDDDTFLPSPAALQPQQAKQLTAHLAAASRPLVLAAPHVFRAANAGKRTALADALDAPLLVLESPRGLRDPASGALAALLKAADCVLYLGKPVDFTSGFAAAGVVAAEHVLMIASDGTALERAGTALGTRLQAAVQADARAAVDVLLDVAKKPASGRQRWRAVAAAALAHRQMTNADNDAARASRAMVETVAAHVAERPDTVLICDGGEIGQWAQAFVSAETRLINGPSGAIGGGLPYAVGAKVARPDAPVLVVMGDGTAGFHFAEFETAAREQATFTALIGNDSRWHAEHLIQVRDYGPDRTLGCQLGDRVRYDLAAAGLGCAGALAETAPQLREALTAAATEPRPTCINMLIPGAPAPAYSDYTIDLGDSV